MEIRQSYGRLYLHNGISYTGNFNFNFKNVYLTQTIVRYKQVTIQQITLENKLSVHINNDKKKCQETLTKVIKQDGIFILNQGPGVIKQQLNQWWPSSMMPYGITRPQVVTHGSQDKKFEHFADGIFTCFLSKEKFCINKTCISPALVS